MPRLRLPAEARTADDTAAAADAQTREKRRLIWTTLTEYAVRHGGLVTSPPGSKRLRIEAFPGSDLASRLIEAGHTLVYRGDELRVTGQSSSAFTRVTIFETILP